MALVIEQGYPVPEAAGLSGMDSDIPYRWKNRTESQFEGKSLSVDECEALVEDTSYLTIDMEGKHKLVVK